MRTSVARIFPISSVQARLTLTALFAVLALLLATESALAVGTAFTYQGQLQDGGQPADGTFDLEFRLYDGPDPVSATELGVDAKNGVAVSGGVFTVTLDFGDQFDGTERWLEIGVKAAGEPAFTYLSPLQALTAAPYALYASSAGDAGTLGGMGAGMFVSEETDPTVTASVKDGVDWDELTGIPTGFADGVDDVAAPGVGVPAGVIVMWSGALADIPTGWALCDGTGGTPDLRDRFVYGASAGEEPGAVGGSDRHSHETSQAGAHSHFGETTSSGSRTVVSGAGTEAAPGGHSHSYTTNTAGGHQHGTNTVVHVPPYFKLAFIMKL